MKAILLIGLLTACGENTDKEAPALVNNTGDTTSCSGTAPVIEAVECENSGVVDHPDYGELPTFTIRTTASDEDGDLSYYQMYIDFDDTLDGEEDESDNQLDPVEGAIEGDECDISNANIGVTIYMQGALPASATTYEWFVRVADSLGKTSEPFMVTCTTPDGNGGGDPNQE